MTVLGGAVILASDVNKLIPQRLNRTSDASTITGTTPTAVLGYTLPWVGTYHFQCLFLLTNPTAVGRPGFSLSGTSTPTSWRWGAGGVHYNTATGSQGINAAGTTYPALTTAVTNSDWTTTTGFSHLHIVGHVVVSAVGTLNFCFAEATGSGGVSVKASSYAIVNFEHD